MKRKLFLCGMIAIAVAISGTAFAARDNSPGEKKATIAKVEITSVSTPIVLSYDLNVADMVVFAETNEMKVPIIYASPAAVTVPEERMGIVLRTRCWVGNSVLNFSKTTDGILSKGHSPGKVPKQNLQKFRWKDLHRRS